MDMVRATGDTEPALSMPGMGDHPTAMAMYAAILTALYRRQATGVGGEVSTSLLANGLWSNSCQVQGALCGVDQVVGVAPLSRYRSCAIDYLPFGSRVAPEDPTGTLICSVPPVSVGSMPRNLEWWDFVRPQPGKADPSSLPSR